MFIVQYTYTGQLQFIYCARFFYVFVFRCVFKRAQFLQQEIDLKLAGFL